MKENHDTRGDATTIATAFLWNASLGWIWNGAKGTTSGEESEKSSSAL